MRRDSRARRSPLRRPLVLVLAVVIGLALAVGIDIARNSGPLAWMGRHGLTPPYEARGQTVRIDGRQIYVDCRGAGRATVVLEGGYGSGAGSWGFVLDEIARFSRVCAWDRPGIGRSDARGLHSAAETASDLRAILAAMDARPPFVVVGHSLGGLYARIFTAANREEVTGLVMVDAYYPDLGVERRVSVPADYVAEAVRVATGTGALIERGEQLDWDRTLVELEATGPLEEPTEIQAVDQHLRFVGIDSATQEALIRAWEAALIERFPNGRITIAYDSDHMIHLRRPDLVVDAARRLVAASG